MSFYGNDETKFRKMGDFVFASERFKHQQSRLFARWNSPTPSGFAQIVRNNFPVLHATLSA
jgi:hypothetical protein